MTAHRRTIRIALFAALAAALVLVPVALAGKGGGGGSKPGGGGSGGGNSLSLVMVTDANGNGLPNYGDQVTFNVTTSATYPSVELDCNQGSTPVYQHYAGFYPSYMWSNVFPLSNSVWTGGAADCTATLFYTTKNGTRTALSTLTFHVDQ